MEFNNKLNVALGRVENCLKLNKLKYSIDILEKDSVSINTVIDSLNFKAILLELNGDIIVTLSCDQIKDGKIIDLQDFLNFINNCTDIYCKEINIIDNFRKNKINYEIKDKLGVMNTLRNCSYDYKLTAKNKIKLLKNKRQYTINFVDDDYVLMEYPSSDIELIPYNEFICNLDNGHLIN